MLNLKRLITFLCPLIFVMMMLHVGLEHSSTMYLSELKRESVSKKGLNFKRQVKTIQWYDTYHNGNGLRTRSAVVDFKQCKYTNCKLLDYFEASNKSNVKHNRPLAADAVIMQGSHLGEMAALQRRDNDQVFVFAERETWWDLGLYHSMMSPMKAYKNLKESDLSWYAKTVPNILINPKYYTNNLMFRGVFNWTMTYRHDSDIPILYGQVIHKRNVSTAIRSQLEQLNIDKDYDAIFKDKKLDVIWLVSHCITKSKREKYVEKLRNHINVDIFGKCGQDLCPKKAGQIGCMGDIIRKYKFVLSFENTFHTDYVTEKLFDWFPRDIIPVVYGMADYKNIVPEGTIINAADFVSPKHLANYLLYVGSNRNIYIRYLKRKKRHITVGHDVMQQNAYCKLCDWLNNLDLHRKSYPKIDKWWQLNSTSEFNTLYKQAVPSDDSRTFWRNFILLTVPIFIFYYVIAGSLQIFQKKSSIYTVDVKRPTHKL